MLQSPHHLLIFQGHLTQRSGLTVLVSLPVDWHGYEIASAERKWLLGKEWLSKLETSIAWNIWFELTSSRTTERREQTMWTLEPNTTRKCEHITVSGKATGMKGFEENLNLSLYFLGLKISWTYYLLLLQAFIIMPGSPATGYSGLNHFQIQNSMKFSCQLEEIPRKNYNLYKLGLYA